MLADDHSFLSLFKTQFLKQKLTADIGLGLDAGPPNLKARVKLWKPLNRAGNVMKDMLQFCLRACAAVQTHSSRLVPLREIPEPEGSSRNFRLRLESAAINRTGHAVA
jgi:hypothetical protein